MAVLAAIVLIIVVVGITFSINEELGLGLLGLIVLSVPFQWHMQNKCESDWWTSGRPAQISDVGDFDYYVGTTITELDKCKEKHPYPWDIFKT